MANEGDGVRDDLADMGAGTGFVMNGRSPAGGRWRRWRRKGHERQKKKKNKEKRGGEGWRRGA